MIGLIHKFCCSHTTLKITKTLQTSSRKALILLTSSTDKNPKYLRRSAFDRQLWPADHTERPCTSVFSTMRVRQRVARVYQAMSWYLYWFLVRNVYQELVSQKLAYFLTYLTGDSVLLAKREICVFWILVWKLCWWSILGHIAVLAKYGLVQQTERCGLSVCLSVTTMCPAKTDEPIKVPFGIWTCGYTQGNMQ